MGIYVNEKLVSINLSHDDIIDTNAQTSTITSSVNGLQIDSLFKRKKSRSNDNDGNPLIYALKERKGFTISDTDREVLYGNALITLQTISMAPSENLVISLPSSARLTSDLLTVFNKTFPLVPHFECFQKITIGDAIASAKPVNSVLTKHKRDYQGVIANLNKGNKLATLEMKSIKFTIRHYFKPFSLLKTLTVDDLNKAINGKRVWLLDDTLTTGASMCNAAELLRPFNPQCIRGVTFFSRLT